MPLDKGVKGAPTKILPATGGPGTKSSEYLRFSGVGRRRLVVEVGMLVVPPFRSEFSSKLNDKRVRLPELRVFFPG